MSNAERAQNLLTGASELPPQQRGAYLDAACRGDAALRAEVESLLRSHDEAGRFLADPTGDFHPSSGLVSGARIWGSAAPTIASTPREREGQMIGRYKLLQPIGEGGFGSVWMAEQREPVKRRVALKIIKLGMDTRQVIARFEAERQALAMMDHPNIAKVLDAGATETGRPYFVMEYIKGVPILEYCDTDKLDTKARLNLFTSVCHAIQHAHHKGIIHRDIKPSNVLITMHDGVPVPKVIDFGIAKATSSELTQKTLFTEHRQMIGTPAYMSPEQAEMSGLDIDTRSDIYSLGVLLYELLTGTTPFDSSDLLSKGFVEMMRIIREVEPHKPSTRLSTLGATGPRTAQQRHAADPGKLSQMLKGDLDWIVMKCLEKDRTRRYETANGLAADIKRHLNDEPITAGAPSAGYKLRKFVRRNKGPVAAGLLVATVLVLGVVGTSVGLIWALSEKTKATLAAESETKAKLDADQRRKEAETNLAYARKGNELLGSVFANLDPRQDYAKVAELRNALKDNLTKATQDLEGSAIGDPLAVAEIQSTLAGSLVGLGAAKEAIPLLLKARETRQIRLGPEHPATLLSMHELALAYWEAGELDLALPLSQETVRLRKATLGPEEPATLSSMNNLACVYTYMGQHDKAIPLFEELLRLQTATLGRDHRDTNAVIMNLGVNYRDAGRLEEAIPLFEEALTTARASRGPDHPETLICMTNLAQAYERAGTLDLAVPLYEETIERAKARLGPDHPHTLKTLNSLAHAYWDAKRFDKSVPLYEEILRVKEANLGRDHPDTLNTGANLGTNYISALRIDEGISLLEETFRIAKTRLGPEHPATLLSMGNLATAYQEAGKLDLALPLEEETLTLRRATLGPDHPETLMSMNNLAAAYWSAGRLDKSIPLFEEALHLHEAKHGKDDPGTLQTAANLGVNYRDAGRLTEAIPLLERAYRASKQNPQLGFAGAKLLDAYTRAADPAKPDGTARVVSLMKELLADPRAKLPKDSPELASQLAAFSQMLLTLKAWDEAEPLIREALTIREAKEPDDWRTFNTRSMLGGALLGQNKLAEAEPLLLDGYRGMKVREATIPAQGKVRIPEALERLVHLYEAKGNQPEAVAWQSKLEAARAEQAEPEAEGGG